MSVFAGAKKNASHQLLSLTQFSSGYACLAFGPRMTSVYILYAANKENFFMQQLNWSKDKFFPDKLLLVPENPKT